jgi:hypothetical protein
MSALGAIATLKPPGNFYYTLKLPLPPSYWVYQSGPTVVLTLNSTTYNKALPI